MANRWQGRYARVGRCRCGIVGGSLCANRSRAEYGTSRLMSRRIAIVEDEPAIRANYAEALRRLGYEVAAYATRADALTAFRARLPDLALVDIGLGEDVDGGFALTRELRALSA